MIRLSFGGRVFRFKNKKVRNSQMRRLKKKVLGVGKRRKGSRKG